MKSNYHRLKSVDISNDLDTDTLITEAFVLLVSGTLAYMGYLADVLILLVFNLMASIGCIVAMFITLKSYFSMRSKKLDSKDCDEKI